MNQMKLRRILGLIWDLTRGKKRKAREIRNSKSEIGRESETEVRKSKSEIGESKSETERIQSPRSRIQRLAGAGLGDRVAGGRIRKASSKREKRRARREKAKKERERRLCKGVEKKAGDAPAGELSRETRAASPSRPMFLGSSFRGCRETLACATSVVGTEMLESLAPRW